MKNSLRLIAIASLMAASDISAATNYVSQGSLNPVPPYTNWATAATTIQQAVNAAVGGDQVVITNGVYLGKVTVQAPLTLLSVNGPLLTIINGGGTNSCAMLTDGASLTGFTLTNGNGVSGGGVYCPFASTNAFVTNCILTGNSANIGGGAASMGVYYAISLYNCTLTGNRSLITLGGGQSGGGGAFRCRLYDCILTGNSANAYGGGADWSLLYNCTLSGNSAYYGGGVDSSELYNCVLTGNSAYGMGGASWSGLLNCTVTGNSASAWGGGGGASGFDNCVVYFNSAPSGPNYYNGGCSYSCTTPLDTNGVGNITLNPAFVDYAGGDLHLQSRSPCINSGNNAYVTTAIDRDGNPRIVSGTVDIGAYEYQGTGSVISYAWLQRYRMPTDGSADYADPDHDGMNNWQEWVCGTNPTNALSVLRMVSAAPSGTNVTVSWQSVAGINYFLQRTANPASSFTLIATNIVGQTGTTSYADTNAIGLGPFFYRVGVASP